MPEIHRDPVCQADMFTGEAEKYHIHFSLADDVIYSIDSSFRFTSISPNVERILGYRPDELIGRSFPELDLLYPEDLERAVSDSRRLLSGEKILSSTYRFLTREGKIMYGEIKGEPVEKNGRIPGFIAVARNVTDQRMMEKALKESEKRYRLLAENARDVIWVLDEELRCQYVSPSVEKLRGYSAEEVMGMKLDRILTPASCEKATVLFSEGLDREKNGMTHGKDWSTTLDLEMVCKDGSTVFTEVMISVIYNDLGLANGLLGITRNITERIRVEEELRRSRQQLEEQVKKRTAELMKANECLQQEIEERKKSEEALKARELELEERQKSLEDMNITMKVLLKQRNEDKEEIEKNLIANINTSLQLYLDKLKSTGLKEDQWKCVTELEMHLKKIGSSFIRDLSSEYLGLSPSEMKVALLIREGKSSKEIAELLNISINTVLFHRNNIRSKVGLRNNKVNLISYFQSFEKNELN